MAITTYSGNPGSGKTFQVVKQVKEWVAEGRLVVSNIPLSDKGKALFGDSYISFSKDKPPACGWGAVWSEYPGAILVIDEPWRFWGSGIKTNNIPEAEKSLFAEHRHYTRAGVSSDIVLVTQQLSQIAPFIRTLVETTFWISALTMVGQPNRFRIDVYSGAFTGREGGNVVKLREMYGKHTADIWDLYISHTNSTTAGTVKITDKRASLLASKFVVYGIPLGILAGIFGIWRVAHSNLGHEVPKSSSTPINSSPSLPGASPVSDGRTVIAAVRPPVVAGQIGDIIIMSDGVLRSAKGCMRLLGSMPTALPVCR